MTSSAVKLSLRGLPEQRVEACGHVEVDLRQPTGRVVGEAELHLVPPVHEDIRVVVISLCDIRNPVDEGDRRCEIGEFEVANDHRTLERPGQAEQPGGNFIVCQ